MVEVKRNEFEEGSRRKAEMVWYDEDEDWRVVVADQGVTRPNRFNVILGTNLYESRHGNGILADTRVHAEEQLGYERAIARATELIQDAPERVAEQSR